MIVIDPRTTWRDALRRDVKMSSGYIVDDILCESAVPNAP